MPIRKSAWRKPGAFLFPRLRPRDWAQEECKSFAQGGRGAFTLFLRAGSCPQTGLKIVPTSPLFVVFRVFRGKKGLEAGGGTAASPSTQGREAAAPPAHANLGAMVLATKNTKSAFFSAFSAISAVKNNAAEVFVFNRKERKERKDHSAEIFLCVLCVLCG